MATDPADDGFNGLLTQHLTAPLGQAVALVAINSTLFSGLVLVWVLDRPFNGRGAAIAPNRMAAATHTVKSVQGADAGAAILCDRVGGSLTP